MKASLSDTFAKELANGPEMNLFELMDYVGYKGHLQYITMFDRLSIEPKEIMAIDDACLRCLGYTGDIVKSRYLFSALLDGMKVPYVVIKKGHLKKYRLLMMMEGHIKDDFLFVGITHERFKKMAVLLSCEASEWYREQMNEVKHVWLFYRKYNKYLHVRRENQELWSQLQKQYNK